MNGSDIEITLILGGHGIVLEMDRFGFRGRSALEEVIRCGSHWGSVSMDEVLLPL
jgi:hypothetical protein